MPASTPPAKENVTTTTTTTSPLVAYEASKGLGNVETTV